MEASLRGIHQYGTERAANLMLFTDLLENNYAPRCRTHIKVPCTDLYYFDFEIPLARSLNSSPVLSSQSRSLATGHPWESSWSIEKPAQLLLFGISSRLLQYPRFAILYGVATRLFVASSLTLTFLLRS